MAALVTIKELRKMNPSDLAKEIRQQSTKVFTLRLGVKLGKEKDSAKYIREKKQLARMKTVYTASVASEASNASLANEAKAANEAKEAKPKKKSSTKKPS